MSEDHKFPECASKFLRTLSLSQLTFSFEHRRLLSDHVADAADLSIQTAQRVQRIRRIRPGVMSHFIVTEISRVDGGHVAYRTKMNFWRDSTSRTAG